MQDKEVDWRIVRGIWNKTQIEYVNGYQKKMFKKYKNGFFFDTEMKTKSGEIIDYETQLRRYKIGTKANWRNPNSTDVKTINENEYDLHIYPYKIHFSFSQNDSDFIDSLRDCRIRKKTY